MEDAVTCCLSELSAAVNQLYGYEGEIPRINYGPCGVFAWLFYQEWNARFTQKVHICFIMTTDGSECDHICIALPDGSLYDGGIGIHERALYQGFVIEDMLSFDQARLETWSYGLDRTYPRFCPDFNRDAVHAVIIEYLQKLERAL